VLAQKYSWAEIIAKRLSHTEVEYFINLWHNEPSLWDSSVSYSDGDVRKAAMSRISAALGLDIGKCTSTVFWYMRYSGNYYQRVLLVGHVQHGHAILHFASK